MREKPKIIRQAGPLTLWKYKSCTAEIGSDDETWATIYLLRSAEPGKGYATKVITTMKEYYEGKGLFFGGSVALNKRMRNLYNKCGVFEYI